MTSCSSASSACVRRRSKAFDHFSSERLLEVPKAAKGPQPLALLITPEELQLHKFAHPIVLCLAIKGSHRP